MQVFKYFRESVHVVLRYHLFIKLNYLPTLILNKLMINNK